MMKLAGKLPEGHRTSGSPSPSVKRCALVTGSIVDGSAGMHSSAVVPSELIQDVVFSVALHSHREGVVVPGEAKIRTLGVVVGAPHGS